MNSISVTKENLAEPDQISTQFFNICLLFVMSFLFFACSQQQNLKQTESVLPNDEFVSREYAQQLELKSQDAINPALDLIRAAYIYSKLGDTTKLQSVISSLNEIKLDTLQNTILEISKAELFNLHKKPIDALNQLNSVENIEQLDVNIQKFYTETKAKSYLLQGNYLASAKERVFINPILSREKQEENCSKIWLAVSKLNIEQLNTNIKSETEPSILGWLELAYINKAFFHNLKLQNEKFEEWEDKHPDHDANNFMPGSIKAIKLALKNQPKKIAVLLPESGPFEKSATAIKQGFLFNFYRSAKNQSQVPEIIFFDTSEEALIELAKKNSDLITNNQSSEITQKSISANPSLSFDEQGFIITYNNVIEQNVDLIIGPINKKYINLLNSQKIDKIPNLTLNYIDTINENIASGLYQFGLAPEHEIDYIIKHAHKNNLKNAAILFPEGDWGQRLSNTFSSRWNSTGGQVVSQASYTDTRGLTKVIEQMLNIDLSEQRFKRLYWYSEGKALFYSRRRQDIDFIYLIATPEMGRQIMPTFAFHDASELPVYANSNIYSGEFNSKDKDMSNLVFTEVPALINPDQSMLEAWAGQDFRYKRLIAMGIDSYDLAMRLSILKASQDNILFGQTGYLSLTDSNRIKREPSLARFTNSKIIFQPEL